MKTLRWFILAYKGLFLGMSVAISSSLGAIKNSSENLICLSGKEIEQIYLTSGDFVLVELRNLLLERVFESFQDPQKDPALYKILIHKVFPIMEPSEQSLEEEINNNSAQWQDFKAFLAFYKPDTPRYNQLPQDWQRQFIDMLYKTFGVKI